MASLAAFQLSHDLCCVSIFTCDLPIEGLFHVFLSMWAHVNLSTFLSILLQFVEQAVVAWCCLRGGGLLSVDSAEHRLNGNTVRGRGAPHDRSGGMTPPTFLAFDLTHIAEVRAKFLLFF